MQLKIYGELRNQIQSYNLTAINPLELSPLVDGNFTISASSQASLAGSNISIGSETFPTISGPTSVTPSDPTVFEEGTFTINVADNETYNLSILGENITYTSGTGATASSIYTGIISEINANPNLVNLVDVKPLAGSDLKYHK